MTFLKPVFWSAAANHGYAWETKPIQAAKNVLLERYEDAHSVNARDRVRNDDVRSGLDRYSTVNSIFQELLEYTALLTRRITP